MNVRNSTAHNIEHVTVDLITDFSRHRAARIKLQNNQLIAVLEERHRPYFCDFGVGEIHLFQLCTQRKDKTVVLK